MSEILQANIFFVIASVATVVFCILVAIALYQLIKILRTIRSIVDRIEAGSEQLAADMHTVRSYVTEGGIIARLFGFFMSRHSKTRKRTHSVIDEDE